MCIDNDDDSRRWKFSWFTILSFQKFLLHIPLNLIFYRIFARDDFMVRIIFTVCPFVTEARALLNCKKIADLISESVDWCVNVNVMYHCSSWVVSARRFRRYVILILTFWHLYLPIVVWIKSANENGADALNETETTCFKASILEFSLVSRLRIMLSSDKIRK